MRTASGCVCSADNTRGQGSIARASALRGCSLALWSRRCCVDGMAAGKENVDLVPNEDIIYYDCNMIL